MQSNQEAILGMKEFIKQLHKTGKVIKQTGVPQYNHLLLQRLAQYLQYEA